jgi:hypothetical protein
MFGRDSVVQFTFYKGKAACEAALQAKKDQAEKDARALDKYR